MKHYDFFGIFMEGFTFSFPFVGLVNCYTYLRQKYKLDFF